MISAQRSLFDSLVQKTAKDRYARARTMYGGTQKRAKIERPLSTKKWIHLVVKSHKAKGALSFQHPRNKTKVEDILRSKASKFRVRIAEQVNMGNHFHLKIKIHSRESFQKFLKSTTALIARRVTGARRGRPFGRFWQGLAYTRILRSAYEELGLKGYFAANRVECNQGYQARKSVLDQFNRWIYRLRYHSTS